MFFAGESNTIEKHVTAVWLFGQNQIAAHGSFGKM